MKLKMKMIRFRNVLAQFIWSPNLMKTYAFGLGLDAKYQIAIVPNDPELLLANCN